MSVKRLLKATGSALWRAAKSKTGRRLGKFGASTALTSVAEKKIRQGFKDMREGRALRKRMKIYNESPRFQRERERIQRKLAKGIQDIYKTSTKKRR